MTLFDQQNNISQFHSSSSRVLLAGNYNISTPRWSLSLSESLFTTTLENSGTTLTEVVDVIAIEDGDGEQDCDKKSI